MSIERRSCASPDSRVTKRLFMILVLMIGILCMFGGYLLGRMARSELKRSNDMLTYNLTVATETLYKKAKIITPKVIHHNDSEKVESRLSDIFNCSNHCCGSLNNYNLGEFVRNAINIKILKLIQTVRNASMYLNSLS